MSGVPQTLHLDNAAEFKSRALRSGCREYGTELTYRPVGRPQFGGRLDACLIAMQRGGWIDYARASAVLDRLGRLLATPERDRMPCLLLHGESNIGKTQIVRKFIRDHPPSFDERRGVEKRQVISMQMTPLPDQQRFYSALLFEIGAPHNPKAGVSVLEGVTGTLLRGMKPRMLVVDEVHHLLAGNYREQRAAMNLLKYLANDLQMSVVLVRLLTRSWPCKRIHR